MSVTFFRRVSLLLLLLLGVSFIILPACYPITNTLTTEVINVPVAKQTGPSTPPVQQPPEVQPRVVQEDYKYISDAIGILQLIGALIAVLVGLLTLIVVIAVAFGFFEVKRWIDVRKDLEEKAKEATKISDLIKQKYNEVKEFGKGIPSQPLTEEPSKDLKKKLDEFARRIEILETLGVTLKADDYFNLATDYYYKKEYEKSLIALEKAIELKPDLAIAWTGKGAALGELGRHEEALEAYEKAIELKPDLAMTWTGKGVALGKLNKNEEALKAFEKVIELKPDYAEAWSNKGSMLGELGRHEEALDAYEKAIELKPDLAIAWTGKGVALEKLDKNEEALDAHEKAIELKPDYAEAWSNKGIALSKLGKFDDALMSHSKAIELEPDYANAWFNLACTYAIKEDKENALKHLKKAIELDKSCKEDAKTDEDFKGLWEDEDFKKLVE